MAVNISKLNSREAVLQSINQCNELGRDKFLKKYGFKRSRLYPIEHEGKTYDSKAIAGVAYGIQHGTAAPKAREFSGGVAKVVPTIRALGFKVMEPTHPAVQLTIGATYTRNNLLESFGGQKQRGIWTPKEFPVVLIFSGQSGEAYGYRDGWTEDGVFRYTGEGQSGDMEFSSGNRGIRDHRRNGKDILVFEDLGKGKGVRYNGIFECAAWCYETGLDKDRKPRKLIVFDLIPVTSAGLNIEAPATTETNGAPSKSFEELRELAYSASSSEARQRKTKTSSSIRTWRERSNHVKAYVLARARGVCEACNEPAPFVRRDGTPYLEPHHTTRLADEGPDHPRWVGAICPNCHRRIHSGIDGDKLNSELQRKLEQIEPE